MELNAAVSGESTGYTNEFVEVQTVYDDASITTACFDTLQELFWTGNSDGRVTSYFGMGLAKYTSFKPKTGDAADIRQLISYPGGDLFVLNSDVLSAYTRTGVNTLRYKGTSFQNMQCMFLNQQQRLFLGGFCPHIYDFDFERMRILRQLSIAEEQSDCIMIKSNITSSSQRGHGVLCTGCSNGQIVLRDPSTLKMVHKFHPHSGSLSDFDVHGNYLVSCGFSLTRSGNLCVDRFLMVYDIRMMRSLTPVQVMIEPCFIHFLPMCSSVASVASQAGCFQIMDINLMTPSAFYQAQVPMGGLATTFSMSGNSQSFAFGHSSGSIHLFNKGENEFFNHYSEPTYFVEPPPINTAYIDINHEMAPLSSIPMPLVYTSLVSDWPNKDYNPKYRPTPPISAELTENARVLNNIASVPNKTNMVRNQIYNDNYKKLEAELEEKSKATSINLTEMVAKFTKPAEAEITDSQVATVTAAVVDQVDSVAVAAE